MTIIEKPATLADLGDASCESAEESQPKRTGTWVNLSRNRLGEPATQPEGE